MTDRIKTKYPGVYYRKARKKGGKGKEKVYYIVIRKGNTVIEQKVGRQYSENMTASTAALIRDDILEGKRLPRKEFQEKEKEKKPEGRIFSRALSDEQWLHFTKSATDSFSLYDSELYLVAINEAGLRLLPNGSTYENTRGKNILELIPDYYNVPERYEKLKEVIKSGKPYSVDEIMPSSKEGEKNYINVRAFKVRDGLGIIITVITERKRTEEALRRQQEYLDEMVKQRTLKLEEANAALKVLLKRREEDKEELEEKMLFSVKELVGPYVEKLKNSRLDESQETYLDIIKSNLNDIVSPLARKMSMEHLRLTHTEIQVANLVKQGKITKEIAELLHLSPRTVESYRDNIRNKLGIKNKKVNLRTYLLSYQ